MKLGNDLEYPSLRGQVPDAEWGVRQELAALYRLAPIMGWDDLSVTHLTAQVPGEPHYLMNPEGLLFEEITASSLVKIDLDGNKISDTPFEILRAGWLPMKAVHAVRADAKFAMHLHDIHGIALSVRREGLLPITQGIGFILADKIAYHAYDGVETNEAHIPALQRSLGDANRLILENHGLLAVGESAYQVFRRMHGLIQACRIQLLAGRGEDLIHIEPAVLDTFAAEIERGVVANNVWRGLLRKLDRIDPGWRD